MKTFGLTGGVGMGKTAAGDFLHQRGVAVVDTDVLARRIVEPGQPALSEIQHAFGNELIAADGTLRRDELARIVFTNPEARVRLEAITHPRIRQLWKEQLEIWRRENRAVGVVVIPLLFETGAEAELDATVCVACSPETQQRRLAERNWTPAHIQQRIAAQWAIEKKMAKADFVVWSEGDLSVLADQLDRIFFRGASSPQAQ